MKNTTSNDSIKAVLLDFGGVLADEGFKNGLYAIARTNGLEPENFFILARDLIYSTGYLTGKDDEHAYWDALRKNTGISGDDAALRDKILKGFTLRTWMFDLLKHLKQRGVRLFILSDQTNWLDELEAELHFFHMFEKVFNSYHTGKSKHDPTQFNDVLAIMDLDPEYVVFVDDTYEHILRAQSVGLKTIWFEGKEDFLEKMALFFPGLSNKQQ